MNLTAPLGLLALLAVPVIVALHLFRNRLPEQPVAALFLFPGTAVASDGGRSRTRLLASPSLWLECLAAVLLAMWLSGFTFADLLPRHLVLVLDETASMSATTTRPRAQALLSDWCDGLAANDDVTLILSGEPPQVVVGPQASASELRAWLPKWQPSMPNHQLAPALDLARQVAGRSGEIVCVSDGEVADPGADVRTVACGQAVGNAAIASVQRMTGEGPDRLLVQIVGYGDVAAGDVVVTSGDRELMRVPLQLGGAGTRETAAPETSESEIGGPETGGPKIGKSGKMHFAVPLPNDAQRVRVQLSPDALLLDNEAWVVPTPEAVVAVCNLLSRSEQEQLELPRLLPALTGWREERNERRAQLILRSSPGMPGPGQMEIVIDSSEGTKQAHRSPFVIDRSHALLSGIELDGIAWQSGSSDLPGQVLVASGSKVLLSAQATADGQRIWCDVDGTAGNLVRSPDWPILFANALELARREVPGCLRKNVVVGDELQYRGGELRQPLQLIGPDGALVLRAVGDLRAVAKRPGRYSVQTKDGQLLAEAAVRFVDARESDLRRASQFDHAAEQESRQAAVARLDAGPMRRVWLTMLLLVLAGNWWWLQRRTS